MRKNIKNTTTKIETLKGMKEVEVSFYAEIDMDFDPADLEDEDLMEFNSGRLEAYLVSCEVSFCSITGTDYLGAVLVFGSRRVEEAICDHEEGMISEARKNLQEQIHFLLKETGVL